MEHSGLKIIKPGFLTLLQDQGRSGFQKYGLSPSGALDFHAYRWGNHLLGNSNSAASLEILWGNCQFLVTASTMIAVTGADLGFTINGDFATLWQTHTVKAGDLLAFGKTKSGIRAYLCIAGGFQSKIYFASRSVCLREKIGTAVQTNGFLPFIKMAPRPNKSVPKKFIPDYNAPLTLRILPTFQSSQFSKQQHNTLYEQAYLISQQADRVAYQLTGKPMLNVPKTMISEGMTTGAVQITQEGLPIVMMNEHPTIGGYPKIGTVFSLDLSRLSQKSPNESIQFTKISFKDACAEKLITNIFFNKKPAQGGF